MRKRLLPKGWRSAPIVLAAALSMPVCLGQQANPLSLTLHWQEKSQTDSGQYEPAERDETWHSGETAVIVCDMWDAHHCYRAVLREQQMVTRMEALLIDLRDRGVTIIHAPSSCVDAYQDHPARLRVLSVPKVPSPPDINSWCKSIPAEQLAKYPIDQSDGGEDDTPQEHEAWEKQLVARGLDPKAPWTKQHPGLTIDPNRDYISDRGDEIWNILEHGGIENVILLGVHTNMCVLGRPFGLRQLAKNDVNVVLMRDLTDSMYNPRMWPHVSHVEGTELIIGHIERLVCPTITSDQILGGKPFRFADID
jgi:nicotinamidase-related amidase